MPVVQSRKRRAEAAGEESSEGSPAPQTQRRRVSGNNVDEDESIGGDGGQTQDASLDEMAKKMVRLALACEFQRRPIRRQDISEKALGPNSRMFKKVFDQAQMNLNAVFGMELVELPTREKITLQQRRAAQKKDSQTTKSGTTSWMLRSLLPSEYHDPNVIPPNAAPTARDEAEYTAIYTVLVSAIKLAGGQLNNDKMERYLQRLKIDDQTPVVDYEKNEKLMKRMEKDGYLARIKESSGTGEDDIYWVIGSRGRVEVGDDGVRGLTQAVYAPKTAEEEDDLERKLNRSLGLAEPTGREAETQNQTNGAGSSRSKNGKRRSNGRESQAAEEDVEGEDSQIEYEEVE